MPNGKLADARGRFDGAALRAACGRRSRPTRRIEEKRRTSLLISYPPVRTTAAIRCASWQPQCDPFGGLVPAADGNDDVLLPACEVGHRAARRARCQLRFPDD